MLSTRWRQWRAGRAKRYLHRYQDLALDVLRQDTNLASQVALQAAANAPDRRTLEYPLLSPLLRSGPRTLPKPTYGNLRRLSETPPARRAINAIADPIVELPWKITLAPPPYDGTPRSGQATATPEQQRRITAGTQMLQEVSPGLTWRPFIEQLVEDLLIFGDAFVEVGVQRDPRQPLRLWPVDAQTMRVNIHWDGDPRSLRYSQGFPWGQSAAALAYDLVELRDTEVLHLRLNPRTSTPFGLGYLEVAFRQLNAFLGAFDFAEKRASNSTPAFIIALGEHVTIEQAARWQIYWENEIEGRGKIPIIGGGAAPTVLPLTSAGPDPLWLEWQEFQIRLIALAFGLSPMRLGLERDVNRNTAEVGAQADWQTISPVAQTLQHALTWELLHKRLGWTDVVFEWTLPETNKREEAEITQIHYACNAISINEIRESLQLPPIPKGNLMKAEFEAQASAPPEPMDDDEEPMDDEAMDDEPMDDDEEPAEASA